MLKQKVQKEAPDPMAKSFKSYTKQFFQRNFSIDSTLGRNGKETPSQGTTLMDLLLLPVLPIIALVRLADKIMGNHSK